jgi:DMSO reductase iron-sulfur subunit
VQKAFHLDLNKCTGCEACVVACAIENELPWGSSWRWVETYNEPRWPQIPLFHLSLACNHCSDAPCQKHCPALAYSKDEATGAVVLDQNRCMGCKYCTWACPYDAPRFDADQGVVEKCTFCNERQKEGHLPACVSQCPTGALTLGELEAEETPIAGFPRTSARPSIRFTPLREGHLAPAMAEEGATENWGGGIDRRRSHIGLRTEWPLALFTFLAAILVGLAGARVAATESIAGLSTPLRGAAAAAFLILALGGMGLSTLHLGRRSRAYRSVLNLRHSWLSREVFFYSAFVVCTAISLIPLSLAGGLAWLGLGAGLAALFSMDSVYRVTATPKLRWHSSQVLSTGILVFALASGFVWLSVGILLLKALFYGLRKQARRRRGEALRPWLSALRLGGIVVPGVLWGLLAAAGLQIAVLQIALGEAVDRCEFYLELEVQSPRREMERALSRQVSGEPQLAKSPILRETLDAPGGGTTLG